MRRSRFCLQPKQTAPAPYKKSPKKSPKKLQQVEEEPRLAPESPIPTPEPVKERDLRTGFIDISIDDDSYDYSDDDDEEEDIEEEVEKLDGYSRKELLEMYNKELNLYKDNMDKVAEIINSKMTTV